MVNSSPLGTPRVYALLCCFLGVDFSMWPLSLGAGKIHLLFEGSAPNGTGFQNSNNRLPGVKIADVLVRLGDERLPRRLRAGNHLYLLLTF